MSSPLDSPQPFLREPASDDLTKLRPILEHWVRDRNSGEIISSEIDSILSQVDAQLHGDHSRYFVVAEEVVDDEPTGKLLGVMGMQDASEAMRPFTSSPTNPNAAELVNAFVEPEARGRHIGRFLRRFLEAHARQLAFDEIIVNSGPRYKETGWPFWIASYGDPVGVAKELYGPGGDAMVWHKELPGQK